MLTHRLDYAIWPDSPVLMHAHSLFWLGDAVADTAVFYRRMLGMTSVAGIASFLFAVDGAGGATAGFLANHRESHLGEGLWASVLRLARAPPWP